MLSQNFSQSNINVMLTLTQRQQGMTEQKYCSEGSQTMMPSHELNLLQQLQQLNRSERKVADIIVADPQRATGMSIASLAKAAGVSEPTVNRLCRKLGVKGYPDFKIQLARSHATGIPYVSLGVAPNDGVEQYTNKIFSSSIASLDAARKAVNPTAIGEAVDYLSQAQQIYFFGMVASGAVAKDAQHKFFALI
jgi:RpiR family carbohydrate utilization transcriptional regulator